MLSRALGNRFARMLVLLAFSAAAVSPAFGDPPPSGSTLIFGGSFSPPTVEHMAAMARMMERSGFEQCLMVPTFPYKPGAAPGEVSLRYSRVAVEHFDETLDRLAIPYRDFKREGKGRASWIGADGKRRVIQVSDYEIENKIKGDTLRTLKHFREVLGGDPRKLFFLAGADLNPSTWTPGTNDWQGLFHEGTWIFINRQDPKLPPTQGASDPLGQKLGEFAHTQFEYNYNPKTGEHFYRSKDPSKPDMMFLSLPSLDVSSTVVKKALIAGEPFAGLALPPSVFREIIESGDYQSQLNDENLKDYLHWMFHRIERESGDPATFRRMTDELVNRSIAIVDEQGNEPAMRAFVAKAWEQILEKVRLDQLVPNMKKLHASLSKTIGPGPAAAYIAGEVIEQTLGPVIAYKLAGAAGLAVSPFIHQEMVTIPAVMAYKRLQAQRRRWRLADSSKYLGDRKLYKEIIDLRNKLLRGDPESIVSRVALNNALGVGDPEMILNVVQSQYPSWIPLWYRRMQDAKITWYDLNVSTNELKGMLGNAALVKELQAKAGDSPGMFGQLLLAAILKDPNAKARLELFTSKRYFKRLSLGDIPPSLMSELKPEEREFVERARAFKTELADAFSSEADRAAFQDTISDFYSIERVVHENPSLATDDGFWADVVDQLVTRYPGRSLNLNKSEDLKILAERLDPLLRLLNRHGGPLFKKTVIQYGFHRPLAMVSGPDGTPLYFDPALEKAVANHGVNSEHERVKLATLDNAYAKYIERNAEIFDPKRPSGVGNGSHRMLSRTRTPEESFNNLELEMDTWVSKDVVEHRWFLAQAYEQGEKYLENVQSAVAGKTMKKEFEKAWRGESASFGKLDARFSQLEADWLKQRKAYQFEEDESRIPGYAQFRARYEALKLDYEAAIRRQQTLVQMMNGIKTPDVTSLAKLKVSIQEALELARRGSALAEAAESLCSKK